MQKLPLLLAFACTAAIGLWLVYGAPDADTVPNTQDPISTPEVDAAAAGAGAAGLVQPDLVESSESEPLVSPAADPERVGATTRRVGRFGPELPAEGRTSVLLPVLRLDGRQVPGEILFVAGPNKGDRVAVVVGETPEPVPVFPGLAIIEARTASGELCRRELLLDHRRETPLELDFNARGWVVVDVTTEDGDPVEGADVLLDGVRGTATNPGSYRCEWRVSGAPLLTIRAPGYAPYRKLLPDAPETASRPQAAELSRACALTVHMPRLPGFDSTQAALLVLVPSGAPMSRTSPVQYLVQWEGLTTVPVRPGSSVRIDGLPNCRLEIFAYHAGGTIGPEVAYVDGKKDVDLALSLQSLKSSEALSGRVLEGGEPVPGASVTLRYANPIRATHRLLGDRAKHARRMPIGLLPLVEQEIKTDTLGRFQLGIQPETIRRPSYVSVTSPDGTVTITRIIDDRSKGLVFDLRSPVR
jgi:hypothetical protein